MQDLVLSLLCEPERQEINWPTGCGCGKRWVSMGRLSGPAYANALRGDGLRKSACFDSSVRAHELGGERP